MTYTPRAATVGAASRGDPEGHGHPRHRGSAVCGLANNCGGTRSRLEYDDRPLATLLSAVGDNMLHRDGKRRVEPHPDPLARSHSGRHQSMARRPGAAHGRESASLAAPLSRSDPPPTRPAHASTPIAPTAAQHSGSDNGSNLIGWRAGVARGPSNGVLRQCLKDLCDQRPDCVAGGLCALVSRPGASNASRGPTPARRP